MARVGDIAEQVRGVTYQKEEVRQGPTSSHVALLTAGNITESGISYDDVVYVPQSRVSAKQTLRKGDVLIAASSGSLRVVGKAGRIKADVDATFGAFCKVLRPGVVVDSVYFSHFFRTPEYRSRISHLAAGANINNLRNEDLNDLEVPIPPIPEQRRIAAILDQADELRTKRRRALTLLDELADSVFLEMFGGDEYMLSAPKLSLGSVMETRGGLQVTHARQDLPLEVPYLRVANSKRGHMDLSEIKTMRVTPIELDRTRLKEGDLLLVEGHGNASEVGRAARWRFSDMDVIHQNHLIRVRPKPEVLNATFVEYYLNSSFVRSYWSKVAKTTSGLNTINMSNVKAVQVLVPSLSRQNKFAAAVGRLEAASEQQVKELALLDELFDSLQHRAFRGKL